MKQSRNRVDVEKFIYLVEMKVVTFAAAAPSVITRFDVCVASLLCCAFISA
jgi:hypothetical protein